MQEGNASVPASSLPLLGWPISQTLDGAALSTQNFGANAARLRHPRDPPANLLSLKRPTVAGV